MKYPVKKLRILLIAALCFLTFSIHANALTTKTLTVSQGVNIYINDIPFTPTDATGRIVEAFVYQGTTYLPTRAISELFGAQISWDGKQETVIVTYDSIGLKSPRTSNRADTPLRQTVVTAYSDIRITVNGKDFVPTDANEKQVPVFSIDGTTYLPARAFTALFDEKISWEGANSGVYIGSHNPSAVKPLPTDAEWETRYRSAAKGVGLEGEGMLKDFDLDGVPEYLCVLGGAGMGLQCGVLDYDGAKVVWCDGSGGSLPLQEYWNAQIMSMESTSDLHCAKNKDSGELVWYARISTGNDMGYTEGVVCIEQGGKFLKLSTLFEKTINRNEVGNRVIEETTYKYQGRSVDASTYETQMTVFFSHLTDI